MMKMVRVKVDVFDEQCNRTQMDRTMRHFVR